MPLDGKNWPQNEVARILYNAANLIRTKGWTQHETGEGPNGESCAAVAIFRTIGMWKKRYKEVSNKEKMLSRETHRLLKRVIKHDRVPEWNDAQWRTKEEVIEALESAAALAEQKELVS